VISVLPGQRPRCVSELSVACCHIAQSPPNRVPPPGGEGVLRDGVQYGQNRRAAIRRKVLDLVDQLLPPVTGRSRVFEKAWKDAIDDVLVLGDQDADLLRLPIAKRRLVRRN
jgi:hypothetical protein